VVEALVFGLRQVGPGLRDRNVLGLEVVGVDYETWDAYESYGQELVQFCQAKFNFDCDRKDRVPR
jgi:hypothetical protein